MHRASFHLSARCRHSGFTVAELLVVLAIMAIIGIFSLAVIPTVRSRINASECLSNSRKWGTAVLLYAAEHNGLPWWNGYGPDDGGGDAPSTRPSYDVWVKPYLYPGSRTQPRCPLIKGISTPSAYSYRYGGNTGLCRYYPKLQGIPAPSSKVVLVSESRDRIFRWASSFNNIMWGNTKGPPENPAPDLQYHGSKQRRGLHFFFLDGHAELVFPHGGSWTKESATYGSATNGGIFYDERQFQAMSDGTLNF